MWNPTLKGMRYTYNQGLEQTIEGVLFWLLTQYGLTGWHDYHKRNQKKKKVKIYMNKLY